MTLNFKRYNCIRLFVTNKGLKFTKPNQNVDYAKLKTLSRN
ncbi:24880_t:CDS:2 [Cetraspora pellucida]|uniref:24880_t:CDS:1 n=1 Tax=Cetraspora pellucida TaxID=1433469 RepID=A0A9N9DM69_9GLOM|nr:24880_t:CDS:2 [Cetraspora pellucida]